MRRPPRALRPIVWPLLPPETKFPPRKFSYPSNNTLPRTLLSPDQPGTAENYAKHREILLEFNFPIDSGNKKVEGELIIWKKGQKNLYIRRFYLRVIVNKHHTEKEILK